MLIVTTDEIPGYRIETVYGEVVGLTVRTVNAGAGMSAGFRAMGGGEVPELTRLVYESRNQAMHRMWEDATRRGANAIVGMRVEMGDVEIVAYGTAVQVRPLGEGEPGATAQSAQHAAQSGGQASAPVPPAPPAAGYAPTQTPSYPAR